MSNVVPNPPKVTLLLHREAQLEDWEKANRTVSLTIDNTTVTSGKYNVEVVSFDIRDIISNLITSTKAAAASQALFYVAHRLDSQSTVLLTQNGMGILSNEMDRVKDTCTFVEAINTHGIFSNGPFSSTLAGKGSLTLSSPKELTGSSSALISLLTSSNILNASTIPWPEFQLQQLEKLAINACINPLTVIFNCKNGELFTQPPIAQLIRLLLSEISQLFRSLPEIGAIHNSEKSWGSSEFNIPTRFSAEELELRVREVADKTAANTSSMLQDVQAGRETEINYITRYILDRGEDHGVDMHFNRQVWLMVLSGRTLKAEDVVREFGRRDNQPDDPQDDVLLPFLLINSRILREDNSSEDDSSGDDSG
jgi:2-dehydropantoate 2-reductase